MKLRQYRMPIVFCGLLGIFVLSVSLIDQLMQPTQTVQEVSQIVDRVSSTEVKEEVVISPVQGNEKIVRYFYEAGGTHNTEALDYFEGVYRQSLGVDYGSDEAFNVFASLSGTVAEVKKDAILGLCVTLECENGIRLIYQSLSNVGLEEGQFINQGTIIGQSGYNVYEAELGNHVHFTIEKENEPINPLSVIEKE